MPPRPEALFDRNEVDAAGLTAIDAERIHLAAIVPLKVALALTGVMGVRACRAELDGTIAKPPGLALAPLESASVVDDEVVSSVLAERNAYRVAELAEAEHNGQSRTIADVLRVFHPNSLFRCSDGQLG